MVAGMPGGCKIKGIVEGDDFCQRTCSRRYLAGLVGKDRATPRIEQLIDQGFVTMIASQIFDMVDFGKSDFRLVTEERRYSMLLANSSEYQEGEAAFGRGLTTRNNPYSFLSPEYWRWQEGLLGNCQPRERQVNSEPYKQDECSDNEARWGIIPVILIRQPPLCATDALT